MNIIAFDTAGDFLSTGLQTDSGFFEENRSSGLRHSEHLLPAVERLMKHAGLSFNEINLIVCSKGPGSFTGLRIGMSTAKGLSTGADCPIVSINNLDLHAYGLCFFDGAVVPLIDARKKRFYSAVYSGGSLKSEYLDTTPEELLVQLSGYKQVLFTGPGCELFRTRASDVLDEVSFSTNFYPQENGLSQALIKLGLKQFESIGPDPDDSGPFYIRLSDAELSKQ